MSPLAFIEIKGHFDPWACPPFTHTLNSVPMLRLQHLSLFSISIHSRENWLRMIKLLRQYTLFSDVWLIMLADNLGFLSSQSQISSVHNSQWNSVSISWRCFGCSLTEHRWHWNTHLHAGLDLSQPFREKDNLLLLPLLQPFSETPLVKSHLIVGCFSHQTTHSVARQGNVTFFGTIVKNVLKQ